MSVPVEDYETGWTIEQLIWALDEAPGDLDCEDDKCCAKDIKRWRQLRKALGITVDTHGRC